MTSTLILSQPLSKRHQGSSSAAGPRVSPISPRIYALPVAARLDSRLCRAVARLHFDWVDVGLRGVEDIARDNEWLDAARAAGLHTALAIDSALLHDSDAKPAVDLLARTPIKAVRCCAAHRIPSLQWSRFLASARAAAPDLIWILDAVGATESETEALLRAGFDWYLSSTKWWDARADWAVEQYDRFRTLARSIGFPQNLAGDDLRTELTHAGVTDDREIAARYRLRYALSAFFDDGTMMPMGYETAGRGSDPGPIDLRPAIIAINRVKAAYGGRLMGLAQRRLAAENALILVRLTPEGRAACCFVANPSEHGARLDPATVAEREGLALGHLRDATPDGIARPIDYPFWLEPAAWRIFVAPLDAIQARPPRTAPRQQRPPEALPSLARDQAARIAIEHIYPEIDGGRFPIKRVAGDRLEVWADILRDGHEVLGAALLLRRDSGSQWMSAPMAYFDNDRWVGALALPENGRYFYCIEAWTDLYGSARERLVKTYDSGQDVAREVEECRALVGAAAKAASPPIARQLKEIDADIGRTDSLATLIDRLTGPEITLLMREWGPRADITRGRELDVVVDRMAARFASWYEMFPRSQGTDRGKSATFQDCIARLDDIAGMGFDVVYLVPIHPIGMQNRKGRNNAVSAATGDPGSPYAIGSAEGGHCAIHPELGTLADFRAFVAACRERHMEVALDFAVQCAPDHPWIAEHPEWFEFRADGSIRFAENPPKKYQDIVNLNFNSPAWQALWAALRDVVLFWVGEGVRIFRVDNPHTKPFPFWEWLIREVQAAHPDVIFLSEAFTRPKVMEELAKLGFTQSYTYFTWRNEKAELTDYFTHLTRDEPKEFFRPHLFTNTPDILPRFLQDGGAPAFRIRAILAATLAGLFGIYNGFELCENRALPNSEEYRDSEKYEYKVWDWNRPGNIKPLIARLNRIRRDNVAFEDWLNLEFLPSDNPRVIFYARRDIARRNDVFVAVSLDPFVPQTANIEMPLLTLGIAEHADYTVEDLLHDREWRWVGARQQIRLDPENPAVIVKLAKPPKAGA